MVEIGRTKRSNHTDRHKKRLYMILRIVLISDAGSFIEVPHGPLDSIKQVTMRRAKQLLDDVRDPPTIVRQYYNTATHRKTTR